MVIAVIVLLIAVVFLSIWVYRLLVRLRQQAEAQAAFSPWLLISPEDAQAGARKGLASYGLLARSDWRPRLWDDNLHALRSLWQPLLVQRLDATDDFYYLVPVGSSDEAIGAVVRVDGLTGEYLESSAFAPRGAERTWGSMAAEWRTEIDTRRRIAARAPVRTGDSGVSATESAMVRVHPPFVWKPCVESRSPFYPFRLVATQSGQFYVRIDGKEFASLTDLGPETPRSQPPGNTPS